MIDRSRSYRTDEQLEAMLDETANWMVNGGHGARSYQVANLRMAVEIVADRMDRGHKVLGVVRTPSDSIIIFAGQLERLVKLIASHELTEEPVEERMMRVC